MIEDVWGRLTGAGPIFPPQAGGELPYVVANMVVSVDGRSSVDGRVGALTAPVDQDLLYRLRSEADAVLAGSGTVLAEGYGDLLPDDHPYERGAAAQPLLAIATSQPTRFAGRSVLDDTRSDLALLTPPDAELPAAARRVHRVEGDDLPALLRTLRADHGVERIVCEGGATLLGSLQRLGLVKQLFLAIAPTVVADGAALPVMRDPAAQDLELLACAQAGGYVFLRYRVDGA